MTQRPQPSAEPFRLAACMMPIETDAGSFRTIESTASVSFLSPPIRTGVVVVDAPRGAILPDAYMQARFLSHSGWKRAPFLCVSVMPAPGMRDHAQLRMLSDATEAHERQHPRERIGLTVGSRVRRSGRLAPDAAVAVTVVDASRGGVCVETPASLNVGDVLFLEGPVDRGAGADFEVLRTDPSMRNRYGGRFLSEHDGAALFEQLVAAAQADRSARRQRAAEPAAPASDAPAVERRGMHHRDER